VPWYGGIPGWTGERWGEAIGLGDMELVVGVESPDWEIEPPAPYVDHMLPPPLAPGLGTEVVYGELGPEPVVEYC